MKPLILISAMVSLLWSCQKEELMGGPREGIWKWQCTVRARSLEDTLFSMADNPTNLYFQTYDFVEETGVYSLDLFLDNQLVQHLVIEQVEGTDRKYWGNTWLHTHEISDAFGNGYTREYFTIDTRVFPPTPPYFMQVLDFPYPGWNRFMFQE